MEGMQSFASTELDCVEHLLARFFHPETSNAEKQSLERNLEALQDTHFSWKFCLANMRRFDNHYVWFFAVSTVERTIRLRWVQLTTDERSSIRDDLLAIYCSYEPDVPVLQREKVAQLLAMVAKRQFPDEFSNYIGHLIDLLRTKFSLGLALCRATGDIITRNLNDVPSERQKRFSDTICSNIPALLSLLNEYCAFFVQHLTANRAGSSGMANCAKPEATNGSLDSNRIESYTTELLQTLQQFFTWAPLATMDDSLLHNITLLAHWDEAHCHKSITALAALSELFYSHKVFPQRARMVHTINALLTQPQLRQAEELYQDKLTELLRVFIDREWMQHYYQKDFPAPGFLHYLRDFTFAAYGALAFAERLGCWERIVHSCPLEESANVDRQDPLCAEKRDINERLQSIVETVIAVGCATLTRMLHHYDSDQLLEVLDNEVVDDNMETELQQYYNQCLDFVSLVTQYQPFRMYNAIFEFAYDTSRPYQQFFELCKLIKGSSATINANAALRELADPANEVRLRWQLRDFGCTCQMLAYLCPSLRGKRESVEASIDWLTSEQVRLFVEISQCSPPDLFYRQAGPNLTRDLIQAVAQLLTSLKSLLLLSGTNAQPFDASMAEFFAQVAKQLAPLEHLGQSNRWNVLDNAAAFILYHASINHYQPDYLLEILQPFTISKLHHLDYNSAQKLRKAICFCIIAPWQCIPTNSLSLENHQNERLLQQYIAVLAEDLLRLELSDPSRWHTLLVTADEEHKEHTKTSGTTINLQPPNATAVHMELAQLKDLIGSFSCCNSKVKVQLAIAYRPIIEKVLSLYRMLVSTGNQASEFPNALLLEFFHSVIAVLQAQLGEPFLHDAIRGFVELFHIATAMRQQLRSLNTLLSIFLLIVEKPNTGTILLPDIVEFTVSAVLPVVFNCELQVSKTDQDRHSEVCGAVFKLFHALLLHRWQYFCKTDLPRSLGWGESRFHDGGCNIAHTDQFGAILNSYGVTITGSKDTQLVHEVLDSLQELHIRWGLFRLEFFRTNFLSSFIATLLQALATPEGVLHSGIILNLLYSMSKVSDGSEVFTGIRSIGLAPETETHLNAVMQATDFPTFTQQMDVFIHDVKILQQPN
ncbi:exportin-6 [Anopheles bellator]|uniref:exportin-6 n=1 Tax=Anopheles bellator TaxID=139047 RepID=UPI002649CF70|nr:exportin-6 [Anopheles bellator]